MHVPAQSTALMPLTPVATSLQLLLPRVPKLPSFVLGTLPSEAPGCSYHGAGLHWLGDHCVGGGEERARLWDRSCASWDALNEAMDIDGALHVRYWCPLDRICQKLAPGFALGLDPVPQVHCAKEGAEGGGSPRGPRDKAADAVRGGAGRVLKRGRTILTAGQALLGAAGGRRTAEAYVPMDAGMSNALISAYLLELPLSTPQLDVTGIDGELKSATGVQAPICTSDATEPFACEPSQSLDLKRGDTLQFTFDLGPVHAFQSFVFYWDAKAA